MSIASLADMRKLFDGIRLDQVSTSMTINSTAAILLAFYVLVAREQGADTRKLNGTIQNDILKEYIARGTYIYPPRQAMRIITDLFAWAQTEIAGMEHDFDFRIPYPRSRFDRGTGSRVHVRKRDRLYRIGHRGGSGRGFVRAAAVVLLQCAFRFSDGNRQIPGGAPALCASDARPLRREERPLLHAAVSYANRRLQPYGAAARCECRAHHDRGACRRCSAERNPCTPMRAMRRSGLPTEDSAQLALRTQQIIAYETGVTNVADPLGGSYYIEELTDRIEAEAMDYIRRIDEMGGTLRAIEAGFIQGEIQNAAFEFQKEIEKGERIIVGVNRFQMEEREKAPGLPDRSCE